MDIKFAKTMKEHIEMTLSEITDSDSGFNLGQKYAYVDVLEFIQSLSNTNERTEMGLDYYIEDVYPLK